LALLLVPQLSHSIEFYLASSNWVAIWVAIFLLDGGWRR